MADKYTDFIFDYAKKFRIRNMENEHLSTLKKMRGPEVPPGSGIYPEDVRTKNQKGWNENADLPDGMAKLEEDQWQELYESFQKTFRSMHANRESFENNAAAIKYLDSYYGQGKLFSGSVITPFGIDAEAEIKRVRDFLKELKDSGSSGSKVLIGNLIRENAGFKSWDELISAINSEKYNEEDKDNTRGKIRKFIYYLRNKKNDLLKEKIDDGENNDDYISNPTLQQKLKDINFNVIDSGFEQEEPKATSQQIQDFQDVYDVGLLQPLILNEKLRGVFKENNGGEITAPIEKAIGQTDFKNKESADYVAESEKDKLNSWQQFTENVKKNADDTILKLRNRALRDKYMLPATSKPIAVDAYSKGFNPKDGLAKFLEILPKLEGKYKGTNPEVAKALKFMKEALEYCKDKMPKAFEGALKNGEQGLAIDMAIARYGIRNDKSDNEIKTAFEVISKLRWGYATSSKRDALFKDNLTIFSDKGLSWNKHEGLQFISKAFDKTIQFGARGIFEIANMGVNAVRQRGKYYKPGDPRASQGENPEKDLIKKKQKQAEARRDQIKLPDGFDKQQYEENKKELEQEKREREAEKQEKLSNKAYKELVDDMNQKIAKKDDLIEYKNRMDYYDDLFQKATDAGTKTQIDRERAELKVELAQKYDISDQKLYEVIEKNIEDLGKEIDAIENDNMVVQTTKQEVDKLDKKITDIDKKIEPFQTALADNDNIEALNKQINGYDEELRTWDDKHRDRFESLMAFRNLVNGQGGYVKDSKVELFLRGQKKVQEKFNANKQALIGQYMGRYWSGSNVGIAA
ncbi:MAG: hypothetical protein LBD50_00575 [Rickettsiales bacterium]|jgi:hypothetical protein|nr:hypothetical protein [Rickettsiales bacterium]